MPGRSSPAVAPRVAICVPLRDERRNIGGLVRSIAAQDARLLAETVLVLAFDGRDDAAEAAGAAALAKHPAVHAVIRHIERGAIPNAGRARRAAMDAGDALLGDDGYLLTTDADTRPDPAWLKNSVAALQSADMVCGHIRRRDPSRDAWREPFEAYLDRLTAVRAQIDPIAHDPAPRHWNEGGASLGLTAAAYRVVGGVPVLAAGEDRALVDAVRHAGMRVRHDPTVRVATSSRATGRAHGGLADALRAGRLSVGEAQTVEHPAAVLARFEREAAVRRAHAHGAALPEFGLDAGMVAAARSAEALFGRVVGIRGLPLALPLAMQFLMQVDGAIAA